MKLADVQTLGLPIRLLVQIQKYWASPLFSDTLEFGYKMLSVNSVVKPSMVPTHLSSQARLLLAMNSAFLHFTLLALTFTSLSSHFCLIFRPIPPRESEYTGFYFTAV